MTRPRTLIVDDDPFVREGLREILEHEGHTAFEAGDGKTALDILEHESVDLLLLDLQLPRISGLEVLRTLMDRGTDMPVVIISGKGSIPTAVESIRLGAVDFIEKPVDGERVLNAVRRCLDQSARRRARVCSLDAARSRYGMIGTSSAIQVVYAAIDRAAPTRARVLIEGESGTGKEMVAAAIHRLSGSANAPFVAVNCAAIPESLIESELFGHEAGAFTDARAARRGSLELADGGTLFLDEVADMSLMTQAKLLRAIEAQEFRRVGGERTIRSDFRVISATNRDLLGEVELGNFRDDLFYRLGVIRIAVPPLRDRPEDIGDLAEYFLELQGAHNVADASRRLTSGARSALQAHPWPGNVRELSNVIENVVTLCRAGNIDGAMVCEALSSVRPSMVIPSTGLREARADFERQFITTALEVHQWRIRETAESLGINRSHLWKKMRRLKIEGGTPVEETG